MKEFQGTIFQPERLTRQVDELGALLRPSVAEESPENWSASTKWFRARLWPATRLAAVALVALAATDGQETMVDPAAQEVPEALEALEVLAALVVEVPA